MRLKKEESGSGNMETGAPAKFAWEKALTRKIAVFVAKER